MFIKKPEVNFEAYDIQDSLKVLLNSEEKNLQLDFESFQKRIQPAIHRKTMEIKAAKRRRNEALQLAIGYGIMIILVPCIILDFWVNGWQGQSIRVIFLVMFFSLLMLGCCPLIVKFREMRREQN